MRDPVTVTDSSAANDADAKEKVSKAGAKHFISVLLSINLNSGCNSRQPWYRWGLYQALSLEAFGCVVTPKISDLAASGTSKTLKSLNTQ